MTHLPPLTAERWLTSWTPNWPVLLLVVLATTGYLVGARRQSGWPVGRTAVFLSAMAMVAATTSSFIGTYDHVLFWALSVEDVLLLTLVPIPLVLSRPLILLKRKSSHTRRPLPVLLGSVLAVGLLLAIYTSGLDQLRLDHRGLFVLIQLALIAAGCGFVGPLLAEGGASYGVRAVVAFVDGLLDAVPGLVVLASHGTIAASYYIQHRQAWGPGPQRDQQIGGSAMVALSELVGLPALLVLMVQWVRADANEAEMTDLVLDVDAADRAAPDDELSRPWWEIDAGPLADRATREGWTRHDAGREP